MANAQDIVDDIRVFVASAFNAPHEAMAACAEQYAVACREANDRLRKCFDTLNRGMRTDAIHLADAPPNLLDLVAILDFPEAADWKQACQAHSMTSPPDLLIDIGAALNDAYAAEQPLAALQVSHRIMALAGAPLVEKLPVMRRIAELDQANAFWDDDIRLFEQARLDQIRQELTAAFKADDATAVTRLRDEAHKPVWRVTVPEDLRRALQDSASRLQSGRALSALRAMLPALDAAYSASDLGECSALMRRWTATVSSLGQKLPADLRDRVDPIISFIAKEDDRLARAVHIEDARQALQYALDAGEATPGLTSTYDALAAVDPEVPAELKRRYRAVLGRRDAAAARRRRLSFAAVAAMVALLAAAGGFLAWRHSLATELDDLRAGLTDAVRSVRNGEVERGLARRKELLDAHARVASDPGITEQLSDFDSAVETERTRAADFESLVHAADNNADDHGAEAQLNRAGALARAGPERDAVAQRLQRLHGDRSTRQARADQLFEKDVESARDGLAKLDLDAMSPDAFAAKLTAARQVRDGLNGRTGPSAAVKYRGLANLDASIDKADATLRRHAGREQALADLKAASTADAHHQVLERLTTDFDDDGPSSAGFRREADRFAVERAVEAWSDQVRQWSGKMMPTAFEDAAQRISDVQGYLKENANSPVAAVARDYLAQLQLGAAIADPKAKWRGDLSGVLETAIISNCYCLTDAAGGRYYVAQGTKPRAETDRPNGKTTYTFDAFTTLDASESMKGVELPDATPKRSAQSRFASAVRDILVDSPNVGNAVDFGPRLVAELGKGDEINPVVRVQLLALLMSYPFWGDDKAIPPLQQRLDAMSRDTAWLTPAQYRDVADKDAFKRAATEGWKAVEEAHRSLVQRRDAAVKAAMIRIDGEGVLLSETSGAQVYTKRPVADGQVAWAIGSGERLQVVARTSGGRWVTEKTIGSGVPDGSLVFIMSGS